MSTAELIPEGLPPTTSVRQKLVELNEDRSHLPNLVSTEQAFQDVKLSSLRIHLEKVNMAFANYFSYIQQWHLN